MGKLPPGQQFQIDALPGESFSIRRDGTLVGIYQPTNKPSQTISLKALEEFYKKRVALTFQNRGKVAVDVLLLPGQEGAATRLVTSAMPIGTQASFTAFPGQQWRIRDLNGKTVGDYTVPAEATSLVLDTTKLSPSSGTSTSGPSILD